MNKMEKALRELSEMDDLAERSSPIHALNPLAKLITTIVYIVVTASFGKYDLPGLIVMVLYPVLLFQISGVPVSVCFYRLRIVLPLVMLVGIFNPIFDRASLFYIGNIAVSGGVVSMITLMLKGVFCLSASFLLIATTSIDGVCAALRTLHVPGMLVTLLLLTYRYVGVMTRELSVMTDAYKLRAPGQKGIRRPAWGSFLGQLLLRSMDRAEALYSCMQLRGFDGGFRYAPSKPFAAKDAAYMMLCCGVIILLRFVRAAALLGRLFVR